MKYTHSYVKLLCLFLIASLFGCISVKVTGSKVEHAKDISFKPPEKPFLPLKAEQIDSAWKSATTGNTISFLTDCGSTDDPSLENLKDSVTRGLDGREYESSEYFSFNGRRALNVIAKGNIDGVSSKTKIVILKKNQCIYILTYGATLSQYVREADVFDTFVQKFEVP